MPGLTVDFGLDRTLRLRLISKKICSRSCLPIDRGMVYTCELAAHLSSDLTNRVYFRKILVIPWFRIRIKIDELMSPSGNGKKCLALQAKTSEGLQGRKRDRTDLVRRLGIYRHGCWGQENFRAAAKAGFIRMSEKAAEDTPSGSWSFDYAHSLFC
jgi:hypothetical protein